MDERIKKETFILSEPINVQTVQHSIKRAASSYGVLLNEKETLVLQKSLFVCCGDGKKGKDQSTAKVAFDRSLDSEEQGQMKQRYPDLC